MATTERTGEPYALAGNRIAFVGWYFVRPGRLGWFDRGGHNVTVSGDLGPLDAELRSIDQAWGVRLKVNPGQRLGPILEPRQSWESGGVSLTTILHDGGIYRAWGSTSWGDLKGRGKGYFCYFESQDGMAWQRPDCGIIECGGSTRNNLLADCGGTVFRDPVASPHERYKWISEGNISPQELEAYRRDRPQAVDPKSFRTDAGLIMAVLGAVSPDGLHWTQLPQPLVVTHSDTQVVAYYDTNLRKYVGYFRDWTVSARASAGGSDADRGTPAWLTVGRRSIGRAETNEFAAFPLPELILEPPPQMGPSRVLYTNCRTTIPGAADQQLMFPTVWDQSIDSTHIALAASQDGKIWNWLGQGPIFQPGNFGQWDGGCIFCHPNLVELANGDFVLPYTGYDVPHKYPRVRAQRATGYAVWPKGRIAGIEAIEHGTFSTVGVVPPGRRLLINGLTLRGGSIRIEAATLAGEAIPGRGFDECLPLIGDCHRTTVRWTNHEDLGERATDGVILRFRLENASIYYVEFI